MAIQISGTTVIDNNRDITNIDTICGNSAAGSWVASQAEAEAGTNNDQVMTPLRVTQAIAAAGGGMVDDDINWSGCNVGCAVRGGGNVYKKTGGLVWIISPSTSQSVEGFPMGYYNSADGDGKRRAIAATGRDGWFTPDFGTMCTAAKCATYWDTAGLCTYWTATTFTACSNVNLGCTITMNCIGCTCIGCQSKCTKANNRTVRLVCY